MFEEEGPITPAVEEEQQQSVETAPEQPEETTEQNQDSAPKEAPMSDAEKRLNQKYNHEKGTQKTLDERIKERRERRQNAVVEDSLEEGEEEGYEIDDGEENAAVLEENTEEQNAETPAENAPAEPEETPQHAEENRPKDEDDDFDLNDGEDEDDVEFIPEELDEQAEQSIRDAEAATAEFEEEAEANATILEGGWVNIEDYSELEFNDEGYLTYEGEILPEDQQEAVMDDLILLGLSENPGFSQEELPDGSRRNIKDLRTVGSNDQLTDLISQTFFYQPNPKKDEESGEDELPKLTVDGKPVKFDKPLASGRQLSQKLSQVGWLAKTKKYFIVTQSQQGKNVAKNKDVRDAMTVALVIEDENNSYVTFLRPLGLTESEGYGPHGSIMVDSETARRNWLLSRHVEWR